MKCALLLGTFSQRGALRVETSLQSREWTKEIYQNLSRQSWKIEN
jgi:hypothetical protein